MIKREIKRITNNSNCCNKKEIFLEVKFSLDMLWLNELVLLGYKDKKSYTKTGLFYIEGDNFIAIGSIGGNKMRVKCKNSKCLDDLDKFEIVVKGMFDVENL